MQNKNDDTRLKDFRGYLEALNRSPNTIDTYLINTGRFLGYIHAKDIESCLDVHWRDIERYQGFLLNQPQYETSSIDSYMRSVRVFYRYLKRQGFMNNNPAELVPLPKLPFKLPRDILNEQEMQDLLDAPDTNTDRGILHRAIIETLYSSGIRLGALCNLTLFDVDTQAGEVTVRKGKGGKGRVVPLGEKACMWIRLYRDTVRPKIVADRSNTNLFLGEQKGRPINQLVVERFVRKYAKLAGIAKQISPHRIRATAATHMLRRGASILHVKEFLGHSLLSTSQRYTKVTIKDLKEAYRKYHPFEGQ